VALILAISSLAYAFVVPSGASSSALSTVQGDVSTVKGDISTVKSQLGSLQKQLGSVQNGTAAINALLQSLTINQKPQTRNITIEWTTTVPGQDRFFPNLIVINQGDTVRLTFISNDTGDGHTFSIKLPTGLFQLNNSVKGQNNFLTAKKFTTGPLNCFADNKPAACNTTGPIGNLTATGTFTVNVPGTYRFRCVFHERIGMFGFLIVLPNAGFKPSG